MSEGYSVVEELFDKHYRVLRVDSGNERIYSIDYYARLAKKPVCDDKLVLDNVTLCYVRMGLCELVISIVNGNMELVSLRLKTTPSLDPAEGSPGKARELCLEEARRLLEAVMG